MSKTDKKNTEINKIYSPNNVENKWYSIWEKSNAFVPSSKGNENYTLMIPPPNVTGILTMGHVLNNSIQDVLVRKARMDGKNTLWLPGTDHASIATEAKVTAMLKSDGIDKREIGREKFLKHAWKWKVKYGDIIIQQLKKLGASCDWSREKFTMDKDYSNAVLEVFVRLYKDGLIYRGERIINWDPKGQTALSDEEVIYKNSKGHLWYFRYPLIDEKGYLIVATTRPETMLGDTGIAVNPKDKRYKNLIGKKVKLPIANRDIPIFSDNFVDMEFGTGCVKVTPAHDPNDFEMGKRNNLEIINIFHSDASLNKNVPKNYQGLDRYVAREKIINELKKLGLLEKVEDYENSIGYSERTNVVVEPYLSKQWFVKMKPLVNPAIKAVEDGKIKIYPKRWVKTYNHWLENIKDWCISRQLWWGHRIPVWYKGNEIYCGLSKPKGNDWVQDADVLDTWFSSWIWPFATLGWPQKTQDLKRFYPTQDLVTGPDIIFFWVARMIMGGLYFCQQIPFSNVYFTGIIRDSKGKKMSKSLGNSPDPLDLFNKYGADAVRVSILMIAPQGLDILYSESRLEQGRNFMNKLWNSARFLLMNIDKANTNRLSEINKGLLKNTDKWILSRLNNTIVKVNDSYEKYKLNESIKYVYDFVWGDYCDWYIEFAKLRFYGSDEEDKNVAQIVSIHIMQNILKLLHPYCPFITEELWQKFQDGNECLITSSWPRICNKEINQSIENNMKIIMEIITAVRNIRANSNISPKKEPSVIIKGERKNIIILKEYIEIIKNLCNLSKVEIATDIEKPSQSATAVIKNMEIFMPLKGLININTEIERLEKQVIDMKGRLKSVNNKLENKDFINRAPKEVIENEQKKQSAYIIDLKKLEDNVKSLKN